MSLPAIEVTGLSKRYVIQHESRHDNLRDTLHHTARKLWRRLRWGTDFEKEEFWALRDISFSVQPGEVIGIIGRNGAGKSTLLKILSRITEPTAGQIRLRGRVASLLEVGTGFHPDLSGRENIYLNGAILGMRRAEIRAKFDEIVAFAEVEKFLDTPVKRYSSGMYVRLAFAVAAHLEPEILIVDEVLAVGDAAFQKKCLGKMQEVSRQHGRTVLLVSHTLQVTQNLAHSVIWLDKGKIHRSGAAKEVCSAYADSTREIEANGRLRMVHPQLSHSEVRWSHGATAVGGNALTGFEFELTWRGDEPVSIETDFDLRDQRGELVAHLQAQDVASVITLIPGQARRIEVMVELPRLAPGPYGLTVFAYSSKRGKTDPLLWCEDIPGLRISEENTFGPTPVLQPTRGVTVPRFQIR